MFYWVGRSLDNLLAQVSIDFIEEGNRMESHHQLTQESDTPGSLLQQLPQLSDEQLKREYLNYLKKKDAIAQSLLPYYWIGLGEIATFYAYEVRVNLAWADFNVPYESSDSRNPRKLTRTLW